VWYEDEAGDWHHERIETLVEERLEDPRTDDFGTLVQELDGDVRVPSHATDGEQGLRPVEAVSKHPSPDHLVRVTTRSGRTVTVTPDHEMHVYDAERDRLVGREARSVDESDQLVTPKHLDSVRGRDERIRFDLLDEFLDVEGIDNDRLMVKGLDKERLYDLFEDAFAAEWDGEFYPLTSTAERFDLSKKTMSNYLYRESLPASVLQECFDSRDELLAFVPDDVELGVKRDSTEIDRYAEINERVATLFGYYAAEGFAREQETPKGTIHQSTICGTESEARDFFLEVLREEFGVEPYEENHAKVTTSGRLLRTFFDTVLDCGVLAHTKQVPQCIFDSNDDIVAAFLRGYFSGDGTVDRNGLLVQATTVSRELKEDVVALLTRLGITAQVNERDPVPLASKFPEFYDIDDESMTAVRWIVNVSSEDAVRFHSVVGFHLSRKADRLRKHVEAKSTTARSVFDGGTEDFWVDTIEDVEFVESDSESVYCLTVSGTHSLIANDLSQKQCDGDEDCVMLLMDGLLNFSKEYLPSTRGGTMDAPLVMSSRIDPTEIDDEAHNMDVVTEYPLELYEASREMAEPGEVDVQIAEDTLGTDGQYSGFDHTHDTSDIAAGPDLSAYKTLGSMMDKMDAQLELARKLRAVDETDVAERVIEYHFLPDLLGNLRAFSSQEVRCLDCGEKYRRMPLTSDCRECGGDMTLTVHEGSVNKYMDVSLRVAEEYGAGDYTIQRLEILEQSLESLFENDKNKQSGIADFM
jgi:DNA polymerase II large subunit